MYIYIYVNTYYAARSLRSFRGLFRGLGPIRGIRAHRIGPRPRKDLKDLDLAKTATPIFVSDNKLRKIKKRKNKRKNKQVMSFCSK